MHAGGPGKRRIKSFGTWKSSGFERKGEKETVSLYPPPHSGLLSLKSGRGRPLGLGSCPPKATRLGRGAGPGVKPPGWQKPGGDPEPPVGRSGHCISALITVSPQCYSVYSSSEGTPLSQRSPPPRQNFPGLDGGNSESSRARSGLALFSNSGRVGGGTMGAGGRGPTLNLGTDSSSSLFLVQIPTTRGSSTISTGRLLDICREE